MWWLKTFAEYRKSHIFWKFGHQNWQTKKTKQINNTISDHKSELTLSGNEFVLFFVALDKNVHTLLGLFKLLKQLNCSTEQEEMTYVYVRGINKVWAHTGVSVRKHHSGVIVCSGEQTVLIKSLFFLYRTQWCCAFPSIRVWLLLTGQYVWISVFFSVLFPVRFLERAAAEPARQRLWMKRQLMWGNESAAEMKGNHRYRKERRRKELGSAFIH